MKIGLIDVDGHNFPNLALMKLSSYHNAQGDTVMWEWQDLGGRFDRIYISRVFDDMFSRDYPYKLNADEVVKGGTGYSVYNKLPPEVENQCPDYNLYPQYSEAYGYLTRGCPRNCEFCIVSEKEGCKSVQVADLADFHRGQKVIKLLDPNILACADHEKLLHQLIASKARIDFTQGVDARLLNPDNVKLLSKVRTDIIHFAWDDPWDEVTPYMLWHFSKHTKLGSRRRCVYILTNYDSEHEQDLYRIYRAREMGYDPYVMIYDKESAPRETRLLQRWANNKKVFKSEPDFRNFDPAIG